MRRPSTLTLAMICGLFILTFGCDDEPNIGSFDVLVSVDREVDNAPATFTFSSQNNGPLEGAYTYLWQFGDGEESEEESPSHRYQLPGDYEVSLTLSEGSGAQGTGNVRVKVMPSVNLEVGSLNFSPMTTLSQGEEGLATWVFKQSAAAANNWRFGLYLVRAEEGSPLPIEATVEGINRDGVQQLTFTTYDQAELSEGALGATEETFELPFLIPAELESGDYYLAVIADDQSQVGEEDREDNLAFSAVPLRIRGVNDAGPDFSLCGLSVTSFEGIEGGQRPLIPLGEQLRAEVCIANLGDRPVIETPYAIYLSEDAGLDEGDLLLARGVEQAIGTEDRLNFEVLLDIPIETPPGVYRLLAIADPEESVLERREDNNLRVSPVPFELVEPGEVEGVDLVVTDVSVDRDRIYWGQSLSGTLSLTHRGDVDVSRLFVIRFNGLPVDMGLPPQQLPSLNVNGIEAGSTVELPFDLSVSPRIAEGRYRLQIEVDPTNSTNDVNPGNNRRSTPEVITLGGEPNFDPAAQSLSLSSTTVEAGQPFEVTLSVTNLGDDPTGNFSAAIYLSSDPLIGQGDVESMLFDVESLEGGESRDLSLSFMIPRSLDQAVSDWYVAARLDPQRALSGELSDENNTIFAENRLVVEGATGGCGEDGLEDNDTADRAVSIEIGELLNLGACDSADWYSVDQAIGQMLEITVTGVADESGEVILPTLALGDGSGAILEVAERREDQLVLVLPAKSQAARPYLRVTGGGASINYNLSVGQLSPDAEGAMMLSGLRGSPGVAEAGGPIEVDLTLTNLGLGTAAVGEVSLELVSDPSLTSPSLGELSFEGEGEEWVTPELGSGVSVQQSARFALPTPLSDGLYYIRASHSSLNNGEARFAWAVSPIRIDQAQACTADQFEPNGSPHEPDGVSIGAQGVNSGTFEELFACAGDDDWYRISLGEGDALSAEISFDRLSGDLDLELYAADGQTLIAESGSLQGRESVTVFRSTTATEYLLRVFLKSSDQVNVATEYTLTIDVGPSESCGDDGFEPNASADEAALLPDGPHDLVVCPGGEDWFRFQVPAGNVISYTVSVGFDDIELSLYDPNDMLVDSNNRRIYHEALLTGTYRLRVSPTQQVRPAPYTLIVSGVSGLDLAASDLRLTTDAGSVGTELYADVQIENRRGDVANDVLVRFVISEDLRISSNDPQLGERVIPEVPGAAIVDLRQRLTIPDGLAPGVYSVICELDPNLTLDDFNLSNNVTRSPFEVTEACIDDDERENEGPRTATELEWLSLDQDYEGVICALTEDWFVITVPAGAHTFTLSTPDADLDLSVYRASDQELLGASQSVDPFERVSVELSSETELYLQVDGFFNANGAYILSWE